MLLVLEKSKETTQPKTLIAEECEEHIMETPLMMQDQGRKTIIEEENQIFKDIEMSPNRNLNESFEETMESGSLKEGEDSSQETLEEEDNLHDLGLFECPGIHEERSIEQTSSKKKRPIVGSRKKRGPEPIKISWRWQAMMQANRKY